MGKPGFEGLQSIVGLVDLLLEGRTLTASSIAADLGVGHAAGARRLKILAELRHATALDGKEKAVRLRTLPKQAVVGDGAVAAACFVSSLATALDDTGMSKQARRLRDEWVGSARRPYATADLDRKFWFVVRGGERALPKAEARLADLIDALLADREITFDYEHFDGQRARAVRVQPLTLAVHEHQFYVIASRAGASPHPFRFARMSNLRVGKLLSYPKEGTYDPRRLFQNVFGIFVGQPDEPISTIKLRFDAKWQRYIESHRWHETQVERPPNDDGTVDITMHVRVCHELRSWILGFGPDVEVLSPASLRAETRRALEAAAGKYRNEARLPGVASARRPPRKRQRTG